MSLHYLKLALRRFRREPGYAALNLVGLTVGLATCFYIVQFVQWELSYDEFHEDADRIYRVVGDISPLGKIAVLHASVGAALEESVPEVQHAGRVVGIDRPLVRADGRSRYEAEGFVYADPGVFDVFTWPLVAGDPDQVLKNPLSVVLSRSLADRLFGADNPVEQTMEIDGQTYTVTGVVSVKRKGTHLMTEMGTTLG